MSYSKTGTVLVFFIVLFFTAVPLFAFAADLPKIVPCDGTDVGGGTECTICHLATLAQNVLNTGIYIAIALSAILFAWAGWKYVTAGCNPGKATQAREVFTNVVIGLVIILAGWLVVDTLIKTLVKDGGGFGPWNKICTYQTDSAGRIRGGI